MARVRLRRLRVAEQRVLAAKLKDKTLSARKYQRYRIVGELAADDPVQPRSGHTATLLPPSGEKDWSVLVAGGRKTGDTSNTDEAFSFDASTARWSPAPRLNEPRDNFRAVLLQDGRVLEIGGGHGTKSVDVYVPPRRPNHPDAGSHMDTGRHGHADAHHDADGVAR